MKKNIFGLSLFTTIILLVILPAVAADADYRAPITITERSGGDLADYPVPITLNTADLVSAEKLRSDCGDLRFMGSDEITQLSYWIKSGCNSANTKIWLRVSVAASSTKAIYMLYGDPSLASESDLSVCPGGSPDNYCYEFYDDFSTKDTYKWSWPSDWGIESGYAKQKKSDDWGSRNTHKFSPSLSLTSGMGIVAETSVKSLGTVYAYDLEIIVKDGGERYASWAKDAFDYLFKPFSERTDWGEADTQNWNPVKLEVRNGNQKIYINNVLEATNTASISKISEITLNSKGQSYWDWISVREFASVEPTVTLGNEERIDITPPTVAVTGAPSSWKNTDATAGVSCTDNGGVGCDPTSYRLKTYASNPGNCPMSYDQYTLTPERTISSYSWVCATAKDNADNIGVSSGVEFRVDKDTPTISVDHSPTEIDDSTDVTISAAATDPTSGVSEIKIYVDNQLKRTCTLSPCLHTSRYPLGTYSYNAEASDKAGNKQASPQKSFKVIIPETITLNKGWNLVSTAYTKFSFISTTCDIGERNFYHYDSATKNWQVVRNVMDMEGGKGYWVYSNRKCEINIFGDKGVSSGDITLLTGWNHIGSLASSANFQSIKGSCTIESILYYDSVAGRWKILTGTDKIEKHKSYFVKVAC